MGSQILKKSEQSKTKNHGVEIVKKEFYWTYQKPQNVNTKLKLTVSGECPKCHKKIRNDFLEIPGQTSRVYKVSGFQCSNCNMFFPENQSFVEYILKDNKKADNFLLNGRYVWDFTAKKKVRILKQEKNKFLDILRKIPSAKLVIVAQTQKRKKHFVIVSDIRYEDKTNDIYHYTDYFARKLLASQKYDCFAIDSKNNKWKSLYWVNHEDNSLVNYVLEDELYIQYGGGYYSKKSGEELVDVLLYSPCTKCYEVIKATWIEEDRCCYTSYYRFRDFIEKFGKNETMNFRYVDNSYSFTKCGYLGSYNLNTESVLHKFGYNVSQIDNLSEKRRREILCDLVDLKIVTIEKIVNHLSFLIKGRTNKKFDIAREKWKSDLYFIENYKLNTERFLIGKSSSKNL